jgi:hypothetical protein
MTGGWPISTPGRAMTTKPSVFVNLRFSLTTPAAVDEGTTNGDN